MGRFQASSKRIIHEWAAWKLVEREFVDPSGARFSRTYVESPGVVVIAALDGEQRLAMVRQYRPALDQVLWELPAGMRDVEGEEPVACAQRELLEEAGCRARSWQSLGQIAQSPGSSNSMAELFLARELECGSPQPHGPEEEYSSVHFVALDEAVEMVSRGDIVNSLAIIGILRLERILR
jgi:ADP-ribose pyrophosphatase